LAGGRVRIALTRALATSRRSDAGRCGGSRNDALRQKSCDAQRDRNDPEYIGQNKNLNCFKCDAAAPPGDSSASPHGGAVAIDSHAK
jgi:hypothetical protein